MPNKVLHYQLFHLIVVGEAYHSDTRDNAMLITLKQSPAARPRVNLLAGAKKTKLKQYHKIIFALQIRA